MRSLRVIDPLVVVLPILLVAGWIFRGSHVFWPLGVLAMSVDALGFMMSAWVFGR